MSFVHGALDYVVSSLYVVCLDMLFLGCLFMQCCCLLVSWGSHGSGHGVVHPSDSEAPLGCIGIVVCCLVRGRDVPTK